MPCEGCTCGAADDNSANTTGNGSVVDAGRSGGDGAPGGRVETGGLAGPEADDYIARQLRSFTSPSDYVASSEGIELAVPLRKRYWFGEEGEDMRGCYIERYTNGGLTMGELIDEKKPIIGIAQTGSDLSPCNSHHVQLAKRVRDGIIAAGGTPFEFPSHPIQETGKRPTAMLDRNLAYLSLVEVLFGYPLDGVVLLTGCDKTYVPSYDPQDLSMMVVADLQDTCDAHGGRYGQHSCYLYECGTHVEWYVHFDYISQLTPLSRCILMARLRWAKARREWCGRLGC